MNPSLVDDGQFLLFLLFNLSFSVCFLFLSSSSLFFQLSLSRGCFLLKKTGSWFSTLVVCLTPVFQGCIGFNCSCFPCGLLRERERERTRSFERGRSFERERETKRKSERNNPESFSLKSMTRIQEIQGEKIVTN